MLGTLKQWKTLPGRMTKLNASAAKPSTEAGLTLLECLIAIAVIGITASLILPPLFLSAGTRVQNRRAEQAFQLAQEEINRLQSMVTNEQHQVSRLPAAATTGYFRNNQQSASIQNVPPPRGGWWRSKIRSTTASCSNNYVPFNPSPNAVNTAVDIVPVNQVLAIDVDGDCQPDFFMQEFRDFGTYSDLEMGASPVAAPPSTARPTVFRVVVRVYSNVPNRTNSWGSMTTPVLPASLQFTRGEGNQRERPLAVMSSLITWSSSQFASCSLQYHVASENGLTLPTEVTNRCRGDVAQIP
ncbi:MULTISPECIES: type II secretion system protein [unclassified Leptolyngbya]|uniref:type II secretion system protein n=1 Tax=unclassified Leptolyngbya TaxID=2650499 RepID=UPI001687DA19|nr:MULTISPECIES: type II secretion system protein [unclassified Leptolyngbya]MBD1911292.1 type II secretion system protein [Leptolyngbya sp. FACHB-8]MBD2156690.1 type II secretion system protein [Leptolyngbya sp. FACHB-16]